MTDPNTGVTKQDGGTGVTRPGVKGICAILAPCEKGTPKQPTGVAKPELAVDTFGYGVLSDFGAYVMDVSGNAVVLVRGTASTAATYGAIVLDADGSATVLAGATAPLDDFDVFIKFIKGATV